MEGGFQGENSNDFKRGMYHAFDMIEVLSMPPEEPVREKDPDLDPDQPQE